LGCYLAGALGLEVVNSEGALGDRLPDGFWHSFTIPQLGNATVALLRVTVLLGEWPATVTDWAAFWRPDIVVAAVHSRLSVPPAASPMKPRIAGYLTEGEPVEEGLLRLGAQSLANLDAALRRALHSQPAVVWRGAPPRHAHPPAPVDDPISDRLARLNGAAASQCARLGWLYLDVWELSDEPGWHAPGSTINYAYPGMPDAWNVRLLDALVQRRANGGQWPQEATNGADILPMEEEGEVENADDDAERDDNEEEEEEEFGALR